MLSSTRARAFLAALITVLFVSALIIYILYGEKKPHPLVKTKSNSSITQNEPSAFEGSGEAPSTDSTDSQAQIPLISDDESISTATSQEPTSTTEPTTTTVFVPVDDKTKANLHECSSIVKEKPKCVIEK